MKKARAGKIGKRKGGCRKHVGVRTVIPGVTVREGPRGATIRYSAMIDGRRFQAQCEQPAQLMLDPETGAAKRALVNDYNIWYARCSESTGTVPSTQIPTIDELAELYRQVATERSRDRDFARPTLRSIDSALKGYRFCQAEAGLNGEDLYTALFEPFVLERVFEAFKRRMTGVSAWTYLSALQSVTARWARQKYARLGYKVEAPLLPDPGKAKKAPEYRQLPAETVAKIEKWYRELASENNKDLYLAASVVYQLAVRPGDAGRLDASNFVQDADGYVHLVYRPRKTIESSNRRVDWPIPQELWEQFMLMAGERLAKGGTLIANPRGAFDKLNRTMRAACGLEDSNKAVYELRKLCIHTVYHKLGPEYAVAVSGDRRETIEKYYADPYKMNDVRPLAIAPLGKI